MRNVYGDAVATTVSVMGPLALEVDGAEVDAWLITGVETHRDKRGQGRASRVLDKALADADERGEWLCLAISPDGTGLDEEALVAFYTRRGFVQWEGDDSGQSYVRRPKM